MTSAPSAAEGGPPPPSLLAPAPAASMSRGAPAGVRPMGCSECGEMTLITSSVLGAVIRPPMRNSVCSIIAVLCSLFSVLDLRSPLGGADYEAAGFGRLGWNGLRARALVGVRRGRQHRSGLQRVGQRREPHVACLGSGGQNARAVGVVVELGMADTEFDGKSAGLVFEVDPDRTGRRMPQQIVAELDPPSQGVVAGPHDVVE